MPTLKIYPPARLPSSDVTETQFSMWQEEMEVYLSQEADFKIFLPDKPYATWLSFEQSPLRIQDLNARDVIQPNNNRDAQIVTQQEADDANEEKLDNIRTNLRTVLSIVGKCVSEGHYNSVIKHSTSLTWIYDMLRSDYDIQNKGVHFFNILEAKYEPSKYTPIAFYNFYRTVVSNNLAKTGDILKYKNNEQLTQDEKFTPMLEDIVLLEVIKEIDARLPNIVKSFYFHKMKQDQRLMDFKTDILLNIPHFLEQLDSRDEELNLHAFKSDQFKKKPVGNFRRFDNKNKLFCRICQMSKKSRNIFTNHTFGDINCPSISDQERKAFINTAKLAIMQDTYGETEVDEEEITEMAGYSTHNVKEEETSDQVVSKLYKHYPRHNLPRINTLRCGFVQPLPSQILTVFKQENDTRPFHIELDSGATVSYIREDEARNLDCEIYPNQQISKLGDGTTKLQAVGEISYVFFRKSCKLLFRAIVCKKLTAAAIGGTNFLRDNGIEQDFVKNVIHLDNRKFTVLPTNFTAIMPTAPLLDSKQQVNKEKTSQLLSFKPRILLPDQELVIPVEKEEGTIISLEPWEQNQNFSWPEPQLKTVTNGKITLHNNSNNPINIGKDVKVCKVRDTTETVVTPSSYYSYTPKKNTEQTIDENCIAAISLENIKSSKAEQIIKKAHSKYGAVFNKDLTVGYNGAFGRHECRLNWATSERPAARKVRVPNYNHTLRGLQQELMDELTDQGVLLIPQDHDIIVQSVCPSFIQRKQRAKNIPEHMLTKNDVRLLINFGPVNELIKPVPIHVCKPDDIFTMLGKWNHIIIFDLHNGYFQNHMDKRDIPWLGVQTPFGGLRVMSRSGQGLAGMAEEFDELTSKILKEEMKEGICGKIVDDCYIGGSTQLETAQNYDRILNKLAKANLKISAEKTHIFPKQADVLGWIWQEGGYLKPSPHRKFAITNTKV